MNRLWLALVVGLAAGGCEGPAPEAPATPGPAAAPGPVREDRLLVFAAASLRDVFTALGKGFKHEHPGVEVAFSFAGTQELRAQLQHGAPADVFASADMRHMDELARASRVSGPITFARNEPVMVVSREAAGKLLALADLPKAKRIVVGAPEVPIGRYTLQILDRAAGILGADFRAKVEPKIVSRELNVRQVLAKVSLGEADAGFVYRTDAQMSLDRVSVVTIPPEINVIAEYPIALVSGAAHPELARAWVALVLSADGQRALREAGFLAAASDSKP
jgi:molybdate transport system substrate-binding protein